MNNPSPLITKLIEHLNKIKIVHSSLNSLQLKDIKEIDQLMKEITTEHKDQKVEGILKEFKEENPKFSLINFYLAVYYYRLKQPGDVYFKQFIIDLNQANHQSFIIPIIKTILEYHETNLLLDTYAKYLEKSGEKDELIEIWKKTFKHSPNNLEIGMKLAKNLESIDSQESYNYYQLVFVKSYDLAQYSQAIEIFKKLLQQDPSNHSFYLHWCKKLALKLSSNQKDELALKESIFISIIKVEEKTQDINYGYLIEIFKIAFEYQVELKDHYRQLLHFFKSYYEDHHFLEFFLKLSSLYNVLTGKVNYKSDKVLSIINDFEKKIQYDQNKLVQHQTFGIGIIKEIKASEPGRNSQSSGTRNIDHLKFMIDFEKKKNHEMSFRIVTSSLTVLKPNHYKGLKLFFKEQFEALKSSEPEVLIQSILESIDKPIGLKEIKEILENEFFGEDEMKKKWSVFKKVIETNPKFQIKNKILEIKKDELSFFEVTYNQLKKTQVLKNQIKIIDFYFSNRGKTEGEDSNKVISVIIENVLNPIANEISRAFFIKYFKKQYDLSFPDDYNEEFILKKFSQLEIEELVKLIEETFEKLITQSSRTSFIIFIKENFKNFNMIILKLLKSKQFKNKEALIQYLAKEKQQYLTDMYNEIEKSYHNHRDVFVLLFQYLSQQGIDNENFYSTHPIEEILHKLIKIYSDSYIKMGQGQESNSNKFVFHLIQKIFFDEGKLNEYLNPSFSFLSLESKQKLIKELLKLNFLENYMKVEIYQMEEKLKG